MARAFLLWALLLLTTALAAPLPPPTCAVPEAERVDCYPFDVASVDACAARGCCWHDTARPDTPFCYRAAAQPPSAAQCGSVPLALRLDCHPEPGASPEGCAARGCCWTPLPEAELAAFPGAAAPWCHYGPPAGYYTTERIEEAPGGLMLTLARQGGAGPFGQDPAQLAADVHFYGTHAARVLITDPARPGRWELKEELHPGVPPRDVPAPQGLAYQVESSRFPQRFGLRVSRSDTGRPVLDTLGSNLLFEPQLLQFSTALPPGVLVHGLGEQVAPWELGHTLPPGSTLGRTHTLWTRDRGTPDASLNGGSNLYGAHAFVMLQDPGDGGRVSGIYLRNSAAMDVTLHPSTHPMTGAAGGNGGGSGGGGGAAAQRMLTFRVTGGIIDLFVFLGPTAEEVLQQYHALIGLPAFPPRWSLGFHVCRWGYENLNAVASVRADLAAARFPVDTFWLDIDYMDRYRDFTLSEHFPQAAVRAWVDELHGAGQHFMIINDPGIAASYAPGEYPPYDSGLAAGAFIRVSETEEAPVHGHVWPGLTAFADFSHPAALPWWRQWVGEFHDAIGFDGLWLDMGEVSDFRDAVGEAEARRRSAYPSPVPDPDSPYSAPPGFAAELADLSPHARDSGCGGLLMDYAWPPFLPGKRGGAAMLEDKTLPMGAWTEWGPQYFMHSLFGLLEAKATHSVLREVTGGKRPFIISRATAPGSGQWGGHWLGDNTATWHDMRMSLAGVFTFNAFGMPMVGTDLCGFAASGQSVGGNAGIGGEGALDDHGLDGELCARWYQMGALLYTFFRVHTMIGRPDQHPTAFSPAYTSAMRSAVLLRYRLIPYMYTLLAVTSHRGGSVVRPLAFEFLPAAVARGGEACEDSRALGILEEQGMLGSALLVSPVLQAGAARLKLLMPSWERWYEWGSGVEVVVGARSKGAYGVYAPASLAAEAALEAAAAEEGAAAAAAGKAAAEAAAAEAALAALQAPPAAHAEAGEAAYVAGKSKGASGSSAEEAAAAVAAAQAAAAAAAATNASAAAAATAAGHKRRAAAATAALGAATTTTTTAAAAATAAPPSSWMTLSGITIDTLPVHMRGGWILATLPHTATPLHTGDEHATMVLTAALPRLSEGGGEGDGSSGSLRGSLFWDDGVYDRPDAAVWFTFLGRATGGGGSGFTRGVLEVSSDAQAGGGSASSTEPTPCVGSLRVLGVTAAVPAVCTGSVRSRGGWGNGNTSGGGGGSGLEQVAKLEACALSQEGVLELQLPACIPLLQLASISFTAGDSGEL